MPNAMALVSEYSPQRSRVTIMMVVANGFTAGAALSGFVAACLLPRCGWRLVSSLLGLRDRAPPAAMRELGCGAASWTWVTRRPPGFLVGAPVQGVLLGIRV